MIELENHHFVASYETVDLDLTRDAAIPLPSGTDI